ncbi:hypothetical protein TNCV_858541 [Trichonephila clavipes]|nr:hypothetical protein TNCV_858541 [Trichonephila clavipes]
MKAIGRMLKGTELTQNGFRASGVIENIWAPLQSQALDPLGERRILFGLRNFEPRSNDENTRAGFSLSELSHHANRRTLRHNRFNVHYPPLHGRSSMEPELVPTTYNRPV